MFFASKTKQNKKAIFSVCILPFPKTLKTLPQNILNFFFSEVSPLLFQGLGGESRPVLWPGKVPEGNPGGPKGSRHVRSGPAAL